MFSQWQDVLELLAHAFTSNHVPHVWAKTGRAFHEALAAFKAPLPHEQGSVPVGMSVDGGREEGLGVSVGSDEGGVLRNGMRGSGGGEVGGDGPGDGVSGKVQVSPEVKEEGGHGVGSHGSPNFNHGGQQAVGAKVEGSEGGVEQGVMQVRQAVKTGEHLSMKAGEDNLAHGGSLHASVSGLAAQPPSALASPRKHSLADMAGGEEGPGSGTHVRKGGHGRGRKGRAAASRAALAACAGSGGVAHGPPRVLLLLVRQGGAGLNLTQAQHVVVVEPLLEPGVVAQAVGGAGWWGAG